MNTQLKHPVLALIPNSEALLVVKRIVDVPEPPSCFAGIKKENSVAMLIKRLSDLIKDGPALCYISKKRKYGFFDLEIATAGELFKLKLYNVSIKTNGKEVVKYTCREVHQSDRFPGVFFGDPSDDEFPLDQQAAALMHAETLRLNDPASTGADSSKGGSATLNGSPVLTT